MLCGRHQLTRILKLFAGGGDSRLSVNSGREYKKVVSSGKKLKIVKKSYDNETIFLYPLGRAPNIVDSSTQ